MDRTFATIGRERPGGLLVIGDSTLGVQRNRIAELLIKHRLPISGTQRGWVEGGLLMSYGSDFVDVFRRGATFVDKILKRTKPADLPVEQPTKFELVINMILARPRTTRAQQSGRILRIGYLSVAVALPVSPPRRAISSGRSWWCGAR
jgi:putative ABC transport system substrate-binding protein